MHDPAPKGHTLRVADLPKRKPTVFSLRPDANELEGIRSELDLISLRKLSFEGSIRPQGKSDWALEATLGATVVQRCVVTLAPVSNRIDRTIKRLFTPDMPEPSASEVEMPEDDSMEELGSVIDLGAIMVEALSLSLPDYPRSEGANLGETVYTEPGKEPLRDEDTKPFAALKSLRDRLTDDDEGTGGN